MSLATDSCDSANMALADQTRSRLPRRPRVLPGLAVLRRGNHDVQVGTDTRHAVVVGGLTPALLGLLSSLKGELTVPELLDEVGTDESTREVALNLLVQLAEAGLLDHASPDDGAAVSSAARLSADATIWALRTGARRGHMSTARRQATVIVHGSGRLGVAISTLLAAAGVGWVHIVAEGEVLAEDTGTGYLDSDVGRSRQVAATEAVHRSVSGVRTMAPPPALRPDLVVLADTIVPCPSVVAPLQAEHTPHLVVRMREGTGVVGPLVLPGRTCCLHCVDLHRADLDPAWPAVAVQLVGRPQPADLAGAHMTAGFGAAQTMLALDWLLTGVGQPLLWNASIEVDAVRGTMVHRQWSPHPDCRCGAVAAEEVNV